MRQLFDRQFILADRSDMQRLRRIRLGIQSRQSVAWTDEGRFDDGGGKTHGELHESVKGCTTD